MAEQALLIILCCQKLSRMGILTFNGGIKCTIVFYRDIFSWEYKCSYYFAAKLNYFAAGKPLIVTLLEHQKKFTNFSDEIER